MKSIIRHILALAYIVYMLLLIYFLFFSEKYGRTNHFTDYQYNLELFKEISWYIRYREILGMDYVMINLVGNVVAFMPFGFFMPSIDRKNPGFVLNFFRVTVLGFGFSVLVEIAQLLTKVGCFDVDDIFLNTIGVIFGYLIYGICHGIWGHHQRKRKRKGRK